MMFLKSLLKFVIVFIIVNFIISDLYSQSTGFLTGKITDWDTGEKVVGATIILDSTKLGANSKIDGVYKVKNIKPGKYKVIVSCIGYTKQEFFNISIKSSETTTLNIALALSTSTLHDVLVTADRSMDNNAAILTQRKNASQVSDGISEEEMKKYPDSDAGQSLKRVSGVTLVNDKFVYVRGISERYSNTTLNGSSLATTEPDKKAFAFDLFPSDLLQNATISKSFTPDLPGNFAGGLVQLNTIDFPSKQKISFNIGSSFNDHTTFKNNSFSVYQTGSTSFFKNDIGNRELPSGLPNSQNSFNELIKVNLKTDDYDQLIKYQPIADKIGKSFNYDSWKLSNITAPINTSYNLSYADIYNVADNDLGIVISGLYNNSYNQTSIYRAELDAQGVSQIQDSRQGNQNTFSTSLGGLINLAYKIGNSTSISLKNTYSLATDDETVQLNGYSSRSSEFYKNYSTQFIQKQLFSSTLSGEHQITDFNNSNLDWKLGISNSLRDEPDLKRLRFSKGKEDSTYISSIIQDSRPQGFGANAGRYFSNLQEKAYSGQLNYTLPIKFNSETIKELKLKIGAAYELKNREFVSRSFTIVRTVLNQKYFADTVFKGNALQNYTDPEIERRLSMGPDSIMVASNFGVHGLTYAEESKNYDSYKAKEETVAAYLMGLAPLNIFGEKIKVVAGARLERNYQDLFYYFEDSTNAGHSIIKDQLLNVSKDTIAANQDRHVLDILPSLNFIWELNSKTNLRFSATQTLTRPSLREIAPFSFYDFQTNREVRGNPSLKRSLIQNYDLRWESFIDTAGVVSAGVFYKNFQDAIEETIINTGNLDIKTFDNAKGKAYLYGLELELRKSLSFISDALDNFSLNSNVSIIKSQVSIQQSSRTDNRTMWGQSPYTVNLGLTYYNQSSGTSFNIGFNTFGKRIIQVANIQSFPNLTDPHFYELPRNLIDLSITQRLFESMNLKFVAKDLLNEKSTWEQGGKTVYTDYRGRIFSLSINYVF